MKKLVFCFLVIFVVSQWKVNAQLIPNYGFAQSSGSFSALSGATTLGSGLSIDEQRYHVTLPFTFVFDNISYTSVYVCANGYVTMGNDPGAGVTSAINSSGTGWGAACGFSMNLASLSSSTKLSYQVMGASPNRIFVSEWQHFGYTGTSNLDVTFQVWLYEGSNTVSMVYGPMSMIGSAVAQVGLRGVNNTIYNSRYSTSGWTNTVSGDNTAQVTLSDNYYPSSGLTFTFTVPGCKAPNQPTSLVLTPSQTSVSGSFTASVPVANKYLVVRTPNVALSTNPVNGTTYTAGNIIGNGTVIYSGSSSSFSSTGLVQNTYYTYTVFGFNDQSCQGGPVYNTANTLSGTIQTLGPKAYIWQPTSGTADFTTPANWVPVRNGIYATDSLYFSKGGTVTIINVPSQTADVIELSNNGNYTFTSASANTLRAGNYLKLYKGSRLTIDGSTTVGFGTVAPLKAATINGVLVLNTNGNYDGSKAKTTFTDSVLVIGSNSSVLNTGADTLMTFSPSSYYAHQRDGGSIPKAIYQSGSQTVVSGVVSTVPTITLGQDFGNFTWNCAAQAGTLSLGGLIDTIRNNLTIVNTNNNILSNSGTNSLKVKGTFIQQGGIFQITKSTNTLMALGNVSLTGGKLDLTGSFVNNVSTFFVYGNLTQTVGHTITKSGTSMPGISFSGTTHQNISIAGVSDNVAINYYLNNFKGATLTGILTVASGGSNTITMGAWDGTGYFGYDQASSTLNYNGVMPLKPSAVEWPVNNGPFTVALNLTGTVPVNRISMPGNRQINTFTITSGVLVLGPYDLTVTTISTSFNPGDPNYKKMVAADSTGSFKRPIAPASSGNAYIFPVGSIKDTASFTPLYFEVYSSTVARTIGVRVRDVVHPNINSANYIPRYWTMSDDGAATCTYRIYVNFDPLEAVGSENMRMNRWDGSTWTQLPGSCLNYDSYRVADLSVDSIISSATNPINGSDFTGRITTSKTYHWTGTINTDYRVTGNWNPARTLPDPSDFLVFDSGHTDTVKNIPTQQISRLTFTNNTRAIFQAGTTAANYFIHSDFNDATDELKIDNGSSLLLTGTTAALRLLFDAGYMNMKTNATIAGRLDIVNTNTAVTNTINFTGCDAVVTTQGVISAGTTNGAICITSTSTNGGLTINGTYEHNFTTVSGNLPFCTWGPASNILIKGYTTATALFSVVTTVNNITYNCPNQISNITNGVSFPTAKGTLSVVSTGTGQWRWGSAAYTYQFNNYNQSAGYVDLSTGNNVANQIINIDGSFTQSGGTFLCSGTGTTAPILNFDGTAAAQSVSFKDASPTGPVNYQISNSNGINLTGTGLLTSAFAINTGGGVHISSAASNPVNTTLSLNYNALNTTLIYDVTGNCTATAPVFPAANGPQNLTVNLPLGSTLTLPFSRTVTGTLKMTSGNINLGANSLILGASAAQPGTLTWTAGFIKLTSGSFTRWYGTSGLPTMAGTNIGYYPLSSNDENRNAAVYFSSNVALGTGGTIAVSYNNVTGNTSPISVTDGAATITSRTNSSWTLTPGNGLALASGTLGMQLTGGNLLTVSKPALLHTMHLNSVAGVHVAGSGAFLNLKTDRIGLALSDLSTAFYIGTEVTVGKVFISVTNGSWNTPGTWNLNAVPGKGDIVIIARGTTVNTSGADTAFYLNIEMGANLTNNTATLQVDSALVNSGTVQLSGGTITLGPAGGGRTPFINSGSLSVLTGTLYINGNLNNQAGSYFNQAGGDIIIDGNANSIAANSVPSGTNLLFFASPNITATAGNIQFIDPPIGSVSYAIDVNFGKSVSFGVAHTFIFGDSISTTKGIANNGFTTRFYNTGSGTTRLSPGNIKVYGSPSNIDFRMLRTDNPISIKGDLTLVNTNAEFYQAGTLYVNGNITVGTGAILEALAQIAFADNTGDSLKPSPNAQIVTGAGIIKNTVTNPTANFSSLRIHNSSPQGVRFLLGDVSFSNGISFTRGNLYMGNNTLYNKSGQEPAAGSGMGWLVGTYRTSVSTLSGVVTFPVGNNTEYTPVIITKPNAGVAAGGSIMVSVTDSDHPAISSGPVLPSKSVNKYYTIEALDGFTVSFLGVFTTLNWQPDDIDAGANTQNFIAAQYSNGTWSTVSAAGPSYSNIIMNWTDSNFSGDYQVGEPIQTPLITRQPVSQTICSGSSASFSITSSSLNYRWQVNKGSGWLNLTNTAPYSGTTTSELDISSGTTTMNGYQYRCKIFNADTAYSTIVTLTANAIVAPALTIAASPGTTICSGSNISFTATPVNGGTTPAYQWKKNGTGVGTNNPTFASTSLANNDLITCEMTSNATCLSGTTGTSNGVTVTVNPIVTPTVTVSADPGTSICPGNSVTFTATPVNGGTTPAYQWKKNGGNVGTNSPAYTDAGLLNGNTIQCIVTSNASCTSTSTATSSTITMVVSSQVTPSITIASNPAGAICTGTSVTFTATVANGGSTPVYQWKKNSLDAGTNVKIYTDNDLQDGDIISCVLTSNAGCVSANNVKSNEVTMTVNPVVVPDITITADPGTDVCSGTTVNYTAVIENGGTTPSYQWKKNNVNAGTNGSTYSFQPADGDKIACIMTSNAACASRLKDTSASIIMVVNTSSIPTVSIEANPGTSICPGTSVEFSASPNNGGTNPAYQWKKNGTGVGTNNLTYTDDTLADKDVIVCEMVSNSACATTPNATSNDLTITVNPVVAPSVTVAASPGTNVSTGTLVTFTATPVNGGASPIYQWTKNGVNVGTNNPTYQDDKLAGDDQISVIMTSDAPCADPIVANGDTLHMMIFTGNENSIEPIEYVSLFPNPGNGYFTIKGKLATGNNQQTELIIFDVIGRVIFQEQIPVAKGKFEQAIRLDKAAAGVYFVKLSAGDGYKLLKLNVER